MDFTGERPIDGSGAERSLALYTEAAKFCTGRTVLDYGCGIGLGTDLLNSVMQKRIPAGYRDAVGYDVSAEAIEEARRRYPHIRFCTEEVFDFFIDYVVCLEVIEHMEKDAARGLVEMMVRRKWDGFLSTPNGDLFPYHPATAQERRGWHVWHYTRDELDELFKPFPSFHVCGLEWDRALGKFVTYGIHVWGK